MVKCQKCGREVPEGEAFEYLDQTLCDDCYMDARSYVQINAKSDLYFKKYFTCLCD
jgi:NMD protein affecting ribosome stability and mRNA decay